MVYRGFEIAPIPQRLPSGRWSAEVTIFELDEAVAAGQCLRSKGEFASQADATNRCVELGKQVVDVLLEG